MIVLAVFYSIGLALFGLDLALPIGVFTGLAVAIPYVGFGLGSDFGAVGRVFWSFQRRPGTSVPW
jgi:predicted PurR-regulated permease PerM